MQMLLVREVAQRLGLDRAEVYRLVRTGVLEGRPDSAGDLRVSRRSVEDHEASAATTG